MQSSPCYDAQLEDKLWGRFQRPLHGLENHTHVEIIVIPFNVGAQDPITKLFAEVTSTANPRKEHFVIQETYGRCLCNTFLTCQYNLHINRHQ